MRSFLLACFVGALVTSRASAVTLWCGGNRSGPFPCPIQYPENGHYYAQVIAVDTENRPINWLAARDEAETLSYHGLPGYLATVTSPGENDFLKQNLSGLAKWLGASDAEVEGEWRWTTGPEAGQLFWRGAQDGDLLTFTDWHAGEPNDSFTSSEGEDFATFGWIVFNDGWNDLPEHGIDRTWVNGYLVEFSPVPEPSSYAMLTIGGAALAIYARRRLANSD